MARKSGKFAKKMKSRLKLFTFFFVTEKIQMLWKEKIMDIFVFFPSVYNFAT